MTISPTELGGALVGLGLALKGLLTIGGVRRAPPEQRLDCGADHDRLAHTVEDGFADCRKWMRGEMDDLHKLLRRHNNGE